MLKLEKPLLPFKKFIRESDAPTNVVGGVAGLTGEPPVGKTAQKKRIKLLKRKNPNT